MNEASSQRPSQVHRLIETVCSSGACTHGRGKGTLLPQASQPAKLTVFTVFLARGGCLGTSSLVDPESAHLALHDGKVVRF